MNNDRWTVIEIDTHEERAIVATGLPMNGAHNRFYKASASSLAALYDPDGARVRKASGAVDISNLGAASLLLKAKEAELDIGPYRTRGPCPRPEGNTKT